MTHFQIKFKNTYKRGFSILESLVYVAILSVMLIAVINAMQLLASSYRGIKSLRSVEVAAINSMDRIIRETRSATSVNTAQTTFNVNLAQSTSTAFTLNGLDASSTAVTIQFYVSGSRLMLKENGITLGPLTPGNVAVTSLVFRSYSTTTSSAVKVEMIIDTASSSGVTTSKNFYGTAVLRGSY